MTDFSFIPEFWQSTCDVCHKTRNDDEIAIYHKPYHFGDFPGGIDCVLNIKYCNDDPACMEGAPKVELL